MNFQIGLETTFNHYNQFLDKGIQNSSACERFNRAKPWYLIKRKKNPKRSKNKRTFESKLHPSTNPRNNKKEKKRKTKNLVSVYWLFTSSQHELGVRDILFNRTKIINTKVQEVTQSFAKNQSEIPVFPLKSMIILCQNNHRITYRHTYQWLQYVKQKWINNMCRDKTKLKKPNKISIKYERAEH